MEKPKGFIPVRNLVKNGKYFRVAVYPFDKLLHVEEAFVATGKWFSADGLIVYEILKWGLNIEAYSVDYGITKSGKLIGTFPATKSNIAYARYLVETNNTTELQKILE